MTPAVGKQKSSRLLSRQVAEDPWRRGGALFLCPCHCRDQPNEKLPGLAASPGTCRLAGHRADWPLGSLHGDPAPASTLTGFFFIAPDAGALPPLLLHVTPLPASPLPGGLPARCADTVGGNTRPGARLTCVLFPCSVPWLPRPLALSPLPPEVPRRPRGHPRSRPRCRLGAGCPHVWAAGTAASPAHPPHVSLTAYRVPQNHGILRVQRDPKVERSRPLALLYTRGVGSRAG